MTGRVGISLYDTLQLAGMDIHQRPVYQLGHAILLDIVSIDDQATYPTHPKLSTNRDLT